MPQASHDPWHDRAAGMRCLSCMWYVPKANASGALVGRCRRHAPTMNGYPVVFATDWCGDHKLDENSLPPPRRDWDGDGLPAPLAPPPPHDPATCEYCKAYQAQVTPPPFNPEG